MPEGQQGLKALTVACNNNKNVSIKYQPQLTIYITYNMTQ